PPPIQDSPLPPDARSRNKIPPASRQSHRRSRHARTQSHVRPPASPGNRSAASRQEDRSQEASPPPHLESSSRIPTTKTRAARLPPTAPLRPRQAAIQRRLRCGSRNRARRLHSRADQARQARASDK